MTILKIIREICKMQKAEQQQKQAQVLDPCPRCTSRQGQEKQDRIYQHCMRRIQCFHKNIPKIKLNSHRRADNINCNKERKENKLAKVDYYCLFNFIFLQLIIWYDTIKQIS